jgi:hypothetical protein
MVNFLQTNRDWIIPLGSTVVILSAFIGLIRWWWGLKNLASRLNAEIDDLVAEFRINLWKHSRKIVPSLFPDSVDDITPEVLCTISKSPKVQELKKDAYGVFTFLRDFPKRESERKRTNILQYLPAVLFVILAGAIYFMGLK